MSSSSVGYNANAWLEIYSSKIRKGDSGMDNRCTMLRLSRQEGGSVKKSLHQLIGFRRKVRNSCSTFVECSPSSSALLAQHQDNGLQSSGETVSRKIQGVLLSPYPE
jgi:hypothetical protein